MPQGVDIRISVRGLRQVQQLLRNMAARASGGGDKTALHARYAIIASQWIDRNFQQQGALVGGWKPLSRNTIVGRRKQSSVILQDTGLLRASFHPQWDDRQAVVGSADKRSLWHEKGTKGSPETPYPIAPRRRIFLAFPHAEGKPLKKAFTFPSRERKFAKGTPFVFTKGPVMHPGLPRRRMVPTEADLLPALLRTTISWLREQERASGG